MRIDATSLPASGSLMPIDHAEVPAMISGRNRRRCSLVPNCSNVGPIWRSANHDVARGAPVEMSASNTTNRSSALRPPPPSATGQVMPSQPRSASSSENSRDVPMSHESSRIDRPAAACSPTARASACRASSSSVQVKSIGLGAPARVGGRWGRPSSAHRRSASQG